MSSSRNGVQATVAEKCPIATYGLQVPRFEPCNLEWLQRCAIHLEFDNVSKLTVVVSQWKRQNNKKKFQAVAASDNSELQGALVACQMNMKKMNLPTNWKRKASDRLYRNSVLLVGVQKLLPTLLVLLYMALYFKLWMKFRHQAVAMLNAMLQLIHVFSKILNSQ